MFEAKTTGQGGHEVHTYFPSIRYPGLVHRLCKAKGRLYTMGSLRPRPDGQEEGWSRKCPTCTKIQAEYNEHPEALLGVI